MCPATTTASSRIVTPCSSTRSPSPRARRSLTEPLTPAVFLDRDGVINRCRPDHVKSWGEFEFLPGVLSSLAALRSTGTPVVVVTNQGAVGRGLLAADRLHEIHLRMLDAIQVAGGQITGIYTCLHARSDGCA